MSNRVVKLSVAAAVLAASVLPAAAADYYGGGEAPLGYHGRDEAAVDGDRAFIERRDDPRPLYGHRRAPGPVVFDERGPDRRDPGYGYGGPGSPRPVPAERFGGGFDRPAAFVPLYGAGAPYGYGRGYRPAAVAVGPAFGRDDGGPDEGCSVERVRSITPAGWEKTVTNRTCYRR